MATWEQSAGGAVEEPPLGDLLRQFTQDSATLIRQEITLARVEVTELVGGYARDAGKVGVAAALAVYGGMALVATAILGIGALLDNYWLSALLVSVLLLAVAAVLVRGALRHMKRTPLKPEATMETLDEDKRWARRELEDLKRQLKH